ncbi:hypothetical protein H6P81_018482 [Aristolochia fimbriata]|uniref:Uncharacterized protein n=1 Tax=Aristolochia fimbriata TaxID=158543 RepID=A0AAV7E1H6_ARIFI|nr:hypothetical protein H6P81_018482 [Aristolochia fimbriata]
MARAVPLRLLPTVLRLFPSVSPHEGRRCFTASLYSRGVDFRSNGLRIPDADPDQSSDSELPGKKSRNETKREARRAVRWGMDLASFSTPQIKRILKVASADREVLEAIMLVKRLGSDVREGKRRQFNYIGRLLRNVQPELMDALIQASKDGDNSKLQNLTGEGNWAVGDVEEDEDEEETEYEEEEESTSDYFEVAMRWYYGLINKDASITSEVYSIHTVDFDRQELRKLVRRVQLMPGEEAAKETGGDNNSVVFTGPKKSLIRFLRRLAKQMSTSEEI